MDLIASTSFHCLSNKLVLFPVMRPNHEAPDWFKKRMMKTKMTGKTVEFIAVRYYYYSSYYYILVLQGCNNNTSYTIWATNLQSNEASQMPPRRQSKLLFPIRVLGHVARLDASGARRPVHWHNLDACLAPGLVV